MWTSRCSLELIVVANRWEYLGRSAECRRDAAL